MGAPGEASRSTAADVGQDYINSRATIAARQSVWRYGAYARDIGFEDLIQEVHVALLTELGPGYDCRIGKALQDSEDSTEPSEDFLAIIRVLNVCINRGVGSPFWAPAKRAHRGKPQSIHLTDLDGYDPISPSTMLDEAMDMAAFLIGLSEIDQAIWHGRLEGRTFREIGTTLKITHQEVARRLEKLIILASRRLGGQAPEE